MPVPAPASPARQIAGFIAKFDPPIQRLIRATRSAVRKRFPTAVELVYDNYNFLVFGFCSAPRASDCIVSLAAYAKGVGLSFLHGATLPDPKRILKGAGKQNRFIPLPSAGTLRESAVEALIRAAIAQAKTPLPRTRGYTVIQSISAKQRPRSAQRPARRIAPRRRPGD